MRVVEEKSIRSIALPPLGDVRPEIDRALGQLRDVDVWVFEPTQKYQNVAKRTGVMKLTPARDLVAEMVRRYWVLESSVRTSKFRNWAGFLSGQSTI
jgi:hypothetical protein